MKLSEKLLSISALKWQLSAGRIWCDSSLVVAVKARAIITFTSYWPASAKWWDVRRANITSVGAFSNMFKNYIIFKHQNCQKVNPIWYPQSNLQCFEVNPNYIVASWGDFFWMPKKSDRSHLWIHEKTRPLCNEILISVARCWSENLVESLGRNPWGTMSWMLTKHLTQDTITVRTLDLFF